VDRVRLWMLPGQTVEDWAKVSDRLCQTFGAQDCRVRTVPGRPHELELWFLTVDPLVEPVQPLPAEDRVNLDGLSLGRCEDGSVYRLKLRGNHVLCAGATGAGKGSVLWSIIDQLAPAVRKGMVEVWALDPKGGMELAFGETLFARFEHRTEGDFAACLEAAVMAMQRRQQALRGVTRLHEPSTDEPLIVVLIDELAALTGYVGDRETKRRLANALGLLLSQGRAVGIVVVAAVQDPRKDTVPARDLFPIRIALRLTEAEQVTLVLGHGARDRGARCDAISQSTRGVGYVLVDGVAEPVRVRFAHITDDHIADLVNPSRLMVIPGEVVEPEAVAA
jgi:DNA segregation ATPase FtsK/SpoIIIE, S-DNA-T family